MLISLACALCGFFGSFTDDAFSDDPASCASRHPEVCDDPTIAQALAVFPYWNYRATASPSGFFLGTANGYLWGIKCEHCGVSDATWQFASGPWAGQPFDSVASDGTVGGGAYRQFTNGDRAPQESRNRYGDLLYRFRPRPGAMLAVVPFVRTLSRLEALTDGTLLLAFGTGETHPHPTIGWFSECAVSTEGGGLGSRPACCTPERIPEQYGPVASPDFSCNLPTSIATRGRNRVCWGGEGDFAACRAAGLRYLGPVWETGRRWSWATWSYRLDDTRRPLIDGVPRAVSSRTLSARSAPEDLAHCVHVTANTVDNYRPRTPPQSWIKTHSYCQFNEERGFTRKSATPGDSGGPTFAWIDGAWYYLGSGPGPEQVRHHTVEQRDEWNRWIFGETRTPRSPGSNGPSRKR
ncbi:MAG: hypothetical protein ACE5FL_03610 [Myxococcota bacterium]